MFLKALRIYIPARSAEDLAGDSSHKALRWLDVW